MAESIVSERVSIVSGTKDTSLYTVGLGLQAYFFNPLEFSREKPLPNPPSRMPAEPPRLPCSPQPNRD
jgi:hypothetical protein